MLLMNTLFVQRAAKNTVSIEVASFIEAVQQANWLANEELWEWTSDKVYATYLERETKGSVIPIGSIEFVQEFLAALHYPMLRAVNIPPELKQQEFLHRRIWIRCNKNEAFGLYQIEGKIEKRPLFVKPAMHPKRFEAITTEYLSEVPDDEPLFVSEMFSVPIVSEWRVFVLRNRIVDLRPYDLTAGMGLDIKALLAGMLGGKLAAPAPQVTVMEQPATEQVPVKVTEE